MVTFIEVVRGDMDLTHTGKVIVCLSRLMEAQPNRTHVYGALTNLEYTTLYHCTGSKTGHTQPVKYEEGVCMLGVCLSTHLLSQLYLNWKRRLQVATALKTLV